MATYVNDLRLKEIATGDEAGTWGTSTNTNLELIGEALGYGTQDCFSTDADATTTVADGATDPARAMYFKVTSSATLTATRTLTIAPNTISRVMFIENATTGSQSINISQGSGANVTIATGKTVVVYLDGAGSGAAVVDALALVDPGVTDTLAEVLVAGNASSGTNIELTTTDKVQFRDSAIYLNSSADGQLDIVADTEVQIAATTIDINGNVDISGTTVSGGKITADAGIDIDNINIDGTTIALSSGDLLFDVAGDITLDAGGGDFIFSDDATEVGRLRNVSAGFQLQSSVSNKDLVFAGSDAGVDITALTLDMSAAGFATFKSGGVFNEDSADSDFRVESNGNTHALFVDAGNDRVGILNSSPSTALDVTGTVTADDVVVDDGTVKVKYSTDPTSTVEGLQLTSQASTTGRFLPAITWGYADSSPDFSLIEATRGSSTGGRLHFATATTAGTMTERVLVDEAGDIAFYDDSGNKKLYWDASVAYLGVGSVTPNYLLDVEGSGSLLRVNATSGNAIQQFSVSDTTSITGITFGDSGSTTAGSIYYRHTGDSMAFSTAGVEAIRIQSDKTFTSKGAAVFNEDSDDADFRIESDSNTHAFFLNAGNGRIGLNQSDPSYALHIGDGTQGERILLETSGGGASIEGKDSVNAPSDSFRIGHLTGTNRYEGAIGTTNLWLFTTTDLIFKPSGGERFRIGTNETVVNEASIDYNFRVESNSATHMLFVDGGTNRVGINNSNPSTTFHSVSANTNMAKFEGLFSGDVAYVSLLNDATSATGNGSGLEFRAHTTTNERQQAFIQTGWTDTTDATRTSTFVINQTIAGAGREVIDSTGDAGMVINQSGIDYDFRVESDSNTHALFVNAGADRVGLFTSSPAETLHVTTGAITAARFDRSATGGVYAKFRDSGTSSNQFAWFGASGDSAAIYSNNSHLLLKGTGAEAVFNEQSNDYDFRVESNNDANAFVVNAGTDNIGMGTNNPSFSAGGGLRIERAATATLRLQDTGSHGFEIRAEANAAQFYSANNRPYHFLDSNSNQLFAIDNSGNITQTNYGAGAAAGPYLTLDRNSASPADSDLIGVLSFRGRDDGANATDYGTIAGKIADVTGGTEDGVMLFNVISGGSSRDVLTLSHNESVFNNGSADQDFRVESDGNANMLYVDGANDTVGIGTNSTIAQVTTATPSSKMAYYTQRVIGSRTAAVAVDGSSNAKTVTIILTNVSLHGQKVDIHTSGHYFNNGANTFYRHTKYYLMSENTNSRISDRTDVFLGGSQTGEVGTPSITLSGSNTWTITIDIGAGYVTDCTVYVEGPGADQITSITFPDQ